MSGEHALTGLDGSDPLAFLAALGILRVTARTHPTARLHWVQDGVWTPVLRLPEGADPIDLVMADLERWRAGHAAIDFAVDADPKIQDLKHPPAEFRALMRETIGDQEASSFIAAYATGVAIDGTGQTKPTALHFGAGKQRFMDAVVDLRVQVTREDVIEALRGPWIGRQGPKDLRWRAASERSRALLSFDPAKEQDTRFPGAVWLAFQALPFFPVVPVGLRAVTTGFSKRSRQESFTWAVWTVPLSTEGARVLVATEGLATRSASWRRARGVGQVFESAVVRSTQGYGNFAGANVR